MTTYLFLLLAITAGVIWWRIADAPVDAHHADDREPRTDRSRDYSGWGGGVPVDAGALWTGESSRLVHAESRGGRDGG